MSASVHWEARKMQESVNKKAEYDKKQKNLEAIEICRKGKLKRYAGFEWIDEIDNPFHERPLARKDCHELLGTSSKEEGLAPGSKRLSRRYSSVEYLQQH